MGSVKRTDLLGSLSSGAKIYAEMQLKMKHTWTEDAHQRFRRLFCENSAVPVWKKLSEMSGDKKRTVDDDFFWNLSMILFDGIPTSWLAVKPLPGQMKFIRTERRTKAGRILSSEKVESKSRFREDKHLTKIKKASDKLNSLLSDEFTILRDFFIRYPDLKKVMPLLKRLAEKADSFSPSKTRKWNEIFAGAAKFTKSKSDNAFGIYFNRTLARFFKKETRKVHHRLIADLYNVFSADDSMTKEHVLSHTHSL